MGFSPPIPPISPHQRFLGNRRDSAVSVSGGIDGFDGIGGNGGIGNIGVIGGNGGLKPTLRPFYSLPYSPPCAHAAHPTSALRSFKQHFTQYFMQHFASAEKISNGLFYRMQKYAVIPAQAGI